MDTPVEYSKEYYEQRYASLLFTSGLDHNFLDRYHPLTTEPEKVDVAAIRHPDGTIFIVTRPGRHGDLIQHMAGVNKAGLKNTRDQGFVTTHGRYINRTEAAAIAVAQGQLLDMSKASHMTYLFSEDIF